MITQEWGVVTKVTGTNQVVSMELRPLEALMTFLKTGKQFPIRCLFSPNVSHTKQTLLSHSSSLDHTIGWSSHRGKVRLPPRPGSGSQFRLWCLLLLSKQIHMLRLKVEPNILLLREKRTPSIVFYSENNTTVIVRGRFPKRVLYGGRFPPHQYFILSTW